MTSVADTEEALSQRHMGYRALEYLVVGWTAMLLLRGPFP